MHKISSEQISEINKIINEVLTSSEGKLRHGVLLSQIAGLLSSLPETGKEKCQDSVKKA